MEQGSKAAAAPRGLVVFAVGEDRYAAPVEEVAGLLETDRLAPLPGRMAPMAGVLAFRGSVVPTLDLADALGVEESEMVTRYAVVLERGTDRFALLVRGMPRLIRAQEIEVREVAPAVLAVAPDAGREAAGLAGATGGSAGPVEPGVLATYAIDGQEVRYLDYWMLMDSVAPPAAFRLTGWGSH